MIKPNSSQNKDPQSKKNHLFQIFEKWKSSLPKSKTAKPVKKYKISQPENEPVNRENTWEKLKRGLSRNKTEEKTTSKSLKSRVSLSVK